LNTGNDDLFENNFNLNTNKDNKDLLNKNECACEFKNQTNQENHNCDKVNFFEIIIEKNEKKNICCVRDGQCFIF